MFKKFQKKIAVNLITGSLGAGKTTLLRQLITQKPPEENWTILVNEFGAIGIDGSIFKSEQSLENNHLQIEQIPGGCICCTAQNELKESIQNIMQNSELDRLFIEPTGLGEPDTLVDLLQSQFFQDHFDIQTIFTVIDSATMTLKEIKQYTILQNLFTMADVIVLNKSDIASAENVTALQDHASNLFPAKLAVITTSQAHVDIELINKSSANRTPNSNLLKQHHNQSYKQSQTSTESFHSSSKPVELKSSVVLPGLVTRQVQTQLSTRSIGWIFDSSIVFDWSALQSLFKSFSEQEALAKPKRAKGVFRVGKPWMLFQWVSDQATREYIAYRQDSRIELLLPENSTFDIQNFESNLKNTIKKDK